MKSGLLGLEIICVSTCSNLHVSNGLETCLPLLKQQPKGEKKTHRKIENRIGEEKKIKENFMKRSFSLLYQHCGISFHQVFFVPFLHFPLKLRDPKTLLSSSVSASR
jgi:hypothetical protein